MKIQDCKVHRTHNIAQSENDISAVLWNKITS